jgi:GTPase SAR1 family protein
VSLSKHPTIKDPHTTLNDDEDNTTMGPIYGQVVAGPPGSGKTTYCTGMQEYLRLLGRNAWVINLDPANEVPSRNGSSGNSNDSRSQYNDRNGLPYDALLDVCESVVNLSSVMRQLGLGPNGGLVYCMEYLEAHVEEVAEMIEERVLQEVFGDSDGNSVPAIPGGGIYLLFDLPGQVELYTHGHAVQRLLSKLCRVLDLRLVAVQLIDAHYCTEPANFLSAALLGTTTMLRLELPAVNVLSKIDLLANYGPLPFALDYFTDCQDLDRLVQYLQQPQQQGGSEYYDDADRNVCDNDDDDYCDYADDGDYQLARRLTRSSPFFRKHERLHKAMAEVVEEFGLISFLPLDISSAESVGRVLARIDKCNGYIFTHQPKQGQNSEESQNQNLFHCAVQAEPSNYESIADIQERLSLAREHKMED